MPVPTNLPRSTYPLTTTPARAMHFRTSSNQSSSSPTITPAGNQHKLNVVTRLAVEGKAKQGEDGVSIKMYLKISLPLDSITPGSTIPLFPEENVKILTSQVHPIDSNSVPYNFSSTVSPLLHNAARALNLPARSSKTFYSVFHLSNSSSNASSKHSSEYDTHEEDSLPIDDKYTGHILVSGYSISYVLPKVFPSHGSDADIEGLSRATSKTRRPSIGERSSAHFMAAIDLWVPYISRPPRSPFLLSIPTPRCLHNHIKLRIFPPSNASNSFASLSSFEEDGVSWDLTSDPHVTRSAHKRPSRSNSYTHFADDESSDSSTAGFSDGCGIQGTFPSAEHIRLRWAKPLKTVDIPGSSDGRRRVGVKEVKGEMVCRVRGKMRNPEICEGEGVVMSVEYKGTCKGLWFSGVATLLGMDVSLESKGSDVSWVGDGHWEVSGGTGYTGFDVGPLASTQPVSRTSSLESSSSPPHIHISPANEGKKPGGLISRTVSTSSTSSLLRAPLPVQNVADYSFEGSTITLASSSPPETMSSISSLPTSTPISSQSSQARSPGAPITLHINMNEILPPAKNIFTFTISGTILVTPRTTVGRLNGSPHHSIDGASGDPEPLVLPRFTVLAADTESTSIVVRHDIEGSTTTVEVYNSTGDIYRDAQARKTVLQKGGFTRCGEEGGRIVLRSLGQINGSLASQSKPPSGKTVSHVPSQSSLARGTYPLWSKRQVPLMIPSVSATVTILTVDRSTSCCSYAVRFVLNASALRDFEWLEFGFAKAPNSSTPTPDIQFVAATVDEIPATVKTNVAAQKESSEAAIAFERPNGKYFPTWAKVNVSCLVGGTVMVDYVVKENSETVHPSHGQQKGKGRARDAHLLHLLLPTFPVPVGRLEVIFDSTFGFDSYSLQTNLKHRQVPHNVHRLLEYSLQEYFSPELSTTILRGSSSKASSSRRLDYFFSLTWIFLLLSILGLFCLGLEMRRLTRSVEGYSIDKGTGWNDVLTTVTVTTTVYGATATRRSVERSPTRSSVIHTSYITLTSLHEENTFTSPTGTPSPLSRADPLLDIPLSQPPSPSPSSADPYEFPPFRDLLALPWSITGLDVNTLRNTLQKAARTMERVWQMFRKVYHYPLDAP